MADLTISDVREKFPQYKDMSDEDLAKGLHKKYYNDMPFEDFSKKIGYGAKPEKKEPEKRKKLDFPQIAESSVMGGLAGAAAPEIAAGVGRGVSGLGSLVGMVPHPLAKAAGLGLKGIGTGISTAAPTVGRVIPSIFGTIGGGVGETAGQVVETKYPGIPAEAARIVGGIAPSMAPAALTMTAKSVLGSGPVNALKELGKQFLEKRGIVYESASEQEKAAIAGLVEKLRGKSTSDPEFSRLYGQLQSAVGQIEAKGAAEASRLTRGAASVLGASESRVPSVMARIEQIGDTSAGPEAIGEKARRLVVDAQSAGEEVRSEADRLLRAEVNQIANQKQQIGNFIENTKAFKDLEKFLSEKTLTGKIGLEQPTATATESGVVSAYEKALSAIRSRRAPIGTSDQPEAVRLAQELKAKGLRVIERKDPNTNVTIYEREFPTAYEALDDFRRRLGQSAKFGEPVTGYEALSAENARDLYGRVSKVQKEFIGPAFEKMQTAYAGGSEALEKFAGKAGKKYTGIDFDDPVRFKTNPKALVNEAFGSKQGVDDLIRLTGGKTQEVQQLASDFVAQAINNKTPAQVESFLRANKDMLSHPSLANLRTQLDGYVYRLKQAEAIARKEKGTAAELAGRSGKVEPAAAREGEKIIGKEFPVSQIKSLITGGDRTAWERVGPILGQSPQGRVDLLQAARETIAEVAAKNPKNAAKLFNENIAPALPMAGIPKAAVDRLGAQINEIANFQIADPAKLTYLQDVFQQFVRQYAIPRVDTSVNEVRR